MKINDFVIIQKVPTLDSIPDNSEKLFGQIIKKKGGATFLHNGEPIRFISVLKLNAGFGARGNHYHNDKHEYMYILSGKAEAKYWLPNDKTDSMIVTVQSGDFISIKPGCVHAYTPLEDTLAVEFSPQVFDPKDDYDPIDSEKVGN